MTATPPRHSFLRAFAMAAALAATATPAVSAVTLVAPGVEPCTIHVPASQETAARHLSRYLKEISGADFPISTNAGPAAGRAIVLGLLPAAERTGWPGDSFLIRADDDTLRILGATPAALLFGVFDFLETALGCRWWSSSEEDVPRRDAIALDAFERAVRARFTQTILMNREAESTVNGFVYKARARNSESWSGGHTLYPLLTPYAEKDPGLYPFSRKTGTRAANKLHFCYSAPGIAEALAEALAGEVRKRGGNVRDVLYMAGMGDWYGGACECERCEAIYLEEGWTDAEGRRRGIIGGTNLRMMNRTAELLEAQFPGVKVGFMAYMSMEAPPTLTRPRHNVYVRIPHLRHCIVHGIDECEKNAAYLRNLTRWCELAPGRVHVWDYGVNFGENFLYPFPAIESIGRNIRLFDRLGVAGLIIQGNYVSTGGDLVALKNYVWRKLLWDPALDTTALIREFCDGYYGPAAEPLFAYVMELEQAVRPESMPGKHLDEFAKAPAIRAAYLSPERMARLRGLIGEARDATADRDPFARRVEEAAVSLDAFALWHPGPFAEAGDRLVRADKNNQYTFERALRVREFSRQASIREWNTFRAYHDQFLAMHGGPLAILRDGDLEVRVAPALGMRIRQILFRGQPLLRVANDPKEKGWPHVGGATEQVWPPWVYGAFVEPPSATAAVMRCEAGDGVTVKNVAVKEVVLPGSGEIRVAVTSERRVTQAEYGSTRAAPTMEYAIGAQREGVAVEGFLPDGAWSRLLPVPPDAAIA